MNIEELKIKVSEGFTIGALSEYFKKGRTTVRYWLKKYSIKTKGSLFRKSWTDEMLINALKNSLSIRQVIIKLGLSPRPGNYPTVKKRIKDLNLNTSHLLGYRHGTGGKRTPIEDMLKEHSPFNRSSIKREIIKRRLIKHECSICKNIGVWRDSRLVLILDHINGINDDYRIENLRLLCPNCNSQQETFCGRGPRVPKKIYFCSQCGKQKNFGSPKGLCMKYRALNDRKVKWPEPEELKNLLQISNYSEIGIKFGVSDNTVKKWATIYNINSSL